MAEKTLKQKLQELSEEPTPFFHSLTPFALYHIHAPQTYRASL